MFNGENEEIEEIEKTIQLYDEAFNEWDIEKLTRAFHPDSMVYWYIPEQDRFYNGLCYRWVRDFIENQIFYDTNCIQLSYFISSGFTLPPIKNINA